MSGIRTVKALAKEDFEIDRFHDFNADFRERNIYNSNIWSKYFPLMELIGNICVILLLSYGGYLVIQDSLEPGELVAFYSLVGYITVPIMHLGFIINMFSQGKASGERLLEILEEKNEIQEIANPVKGKKIKGKVEFKNVSLKYRGDEKEALSNITFKAEPGSVIGLLGATGSEKQVSPSLFRDFTTGPRVKF